MGNKREENSRVKIKFKKVLNNFTSKSQGITHLAVNSEEQ